MILVVRHGRGRGRMPDYMQTGLAHLRAMRPALQRAIRLYVTGEPRPSLAGVRAVVFWLADPLREHFPECFADASAIADDARLRDIPCVNPPETLSNSIKSVQARIWQAEGIPTPPHFRFTSRDELLAIAARAAYPVIVRTDREHMQHRMRLCATHAEVEALGPNDVRFPGTVTPFVDVRAGYRASRPGSIFARFHHKKRAIVLGSTVRSDELFFSPSPIVGSPTCTFRRFAYWRANFRLFARVLPSHRQALSAERAFCDEGNPHADVMMRAARALGFAYAAIDYAEHVDGSVVLWEANPFFSIPPVDVMYLARERRLAERQIALFDAIGDFFELLLGGAAAAA